ncbi:metallophosphoesterase [Salmonella enterica subsp. enterica serovar Corvallis]|uniref:metallophosphoesterase n=1 Tax=Citrobacter braakii TaxID=57706 RepID=UPI0012F01FB6|nr:metallophosphoesterase [Citrobacter braakii]EBY1977419.1 exonuclease SbcCD subunit D [Salmonella enterica subsp. enterica serovar Corvallis]EDH2757556.1 exonuclease SbcCD subunit D [Salmonella enterica]EDS1506018.1 exonuclease SbcCD subunit D [Salmonella enterica]EDW7624362.1 exonuclease SbcCD subunit D [Salmonella enterica]EEP0032490.1 exonuclease SbcCD subunit D [Salmonella enterica subsp. enterica serovar Corvallis]
MTLPYGVISDPHYHRWDAFATTNADGLNSRLEIQLDATKEAAKAMKAAGCKHMLVAGDTFHVRGAISPSVLHFVTETYEWIIKELGLEVVMLAGNHDLETNDSVYSANAAASLRSIGVEIVCGKRSHSIKMGDVTVHLISWRNNHAELISDLKTLRSGLDGDNHDVVVHTSINKAIPTMPDVGIDAQELKDIGFRLLLSGHYHNHKEVLPGVVSIGALTHQNWGDVGSLAGFMIVNPDGTFTHHETSAPKFVNLEDDVEDDQIRGNYVRFRAVVESDEEGIKLQNVLKTMGAKGVVCNFIRKASMMEGAASTAETSKIDSLGESVAAYCKIVHDTDGGFDLSKLDMLCQEILTEAESAEAM